MGDTVVGETDVMSGNVGPDTFAFNFAGTTGGAVTSASNLVITDLSPEDTLLFDDAADTLDTLAEVDGAAGVTDDGTDVTITFGAATTTAITITLQGIGTGAIDSLQDLVDAGFDFAFA